MDFKTFAKVVQQRASKIHKNGVQQWSLSDWLVEYGGESGEMMNIVKKLNRIRDNLIGNSTLTENELREMLADELGDCVISLQLFALAAGIHLEVAVARKFNATSSKLGLSERLFASANVPLFFPVKPKARYEAVSDELGSYDIWDNYRNDYVMYNLPKAAAEKAAQAFSERDR